MGNDFDLTQLASDADAIADSDTGGGEDFRYMGVTYAGVFNEVDRELTFELEGRDDRRMVDLDVPRVSLTVGMPVDSEIYRPFDSTTYSIIKANPDEAWWRYRLARPY